MSALCTSLTGGISTDEVCGTTGFAAIAPISSRRKVMERPGNLPAAHRQSAVELKTNQLFKRLVQPLGAHMLDVS